MKLELYLDIGYPTATRREIVEVDDDLTDEDLDQYLSEWMWNYIDCNWRKVNE